VLVRRDRDGDRSGPRAHVHDGRGAARDKVACRVDEKLRLGSWDEDPRIDAETQPVELLEPAQVRDRLAAASPVDEVLEQRGLRGGEHTFGVGEQGFLPHAEHVRQQHVGIERRRPGVGRGPQARGRRGARLAPRRHAGSIVAA
jgi:hypothetical protein